MIKKGSFCLLILLDGIVAFTQDSRNVTLLDVWTKTEIPQFQNESTFSSVWGFTIEGKEYAVIGATVGGYLLQIENEELIELGLIPSRGGFPSNIINRAYKTYRNYLYCISGESPGLQIVDLNFLPDSINIVYSNASTVLYGHNIYIDTAKATMYICGTSDVLSVYSLANPVNPQLISTLEDYTYIHDLFVRNDTAYLNCGVEGLYVYKFNNGMNPQLLGSLDFYPDQGYNHSGWLSENGKYYVFADETDGKRAKICDVSDLSDIRIIDYFNSEGDSLTILHNLIWKDDFVYTAHYYDGLQIFDAREKSNVKRVAWYDTYTQNSNRFSGAWGVYPFYKDNKVIISDMNNGLFLFKVNLPPYIISDEGEFGIYPNPTSEEAMFYYDSDTEFKYSFAVFDAIGKQVFRLQDINSNFLRFDVSTLSAGTYFYHWEGIDNSVSLKGKFIVTK